MQSRPQSSSREPVWRARQGSGSCTPAVTMPSQANNLTAECVPRPGSRQGTANTLGQRFSKAIREVLWVCAARHAWRGDAGSTPRPAVARIIHKQWISYKQSYVWQNVRSRPRLVARPKAGCRHRFALKGFWFGLLCCLLRLLLLYLVPSVLVLWCWWLIASGRRVM